jgi:hypothetical protein
LHPDTQLVLEVSSQCEVFHWSLSISVRYFDQKQNYNVRSLLHIIYINMEPLFYFGHTQEEQFFRKCRQEHLK